MKKVFLVFSLALIGGLSACKVTEVIKGPVIPADSVVSVGINPLVFTMVIGQQQQFTAEVKNGLGVNISSKSPVWSSSDPSKATVSTTGVVTAVSQGAVIIRATADGVVGQTPIAITEIPVQTIIITPSSANLFLGQTITPRVELRGPSNQLLTNRFVEWTSTNPAVATVNSLGVITAINIGTTTIRVTSEGKSSNFTLNVSVVPAHSISLSTTGPLYLGRNTQLLVIARDIDGNQLSLTGRSITWSVNDPSVASITNTGILRGLTPGNISVAALVDGKLAIMNGSVSVVDIDTLVITPNDTTPVRVGFTRQLTATAFDDNGISIEGDALAGRTFFWTSETPQIAVITNSGLVTGVSSGEATIRVSVNGISTRRVIKVIL